MRSAQLLPAAAVWVIVYIVYYCKKWTRAGDVCPAVTCSSFSGHCKHCVLTVRGGQGQVRSAQLLDIAAAWVIVYIVYSLLEVDKSR